MILNVVDMHKAFLDGIKKEYTGVVPIATFNRYINRAQLVVVLRKLPSLEIVQKRIDDLQCLSIVTDGVMTYGGNTMFPIAPDGGSGYVFSLPVNPVVSLPCVDPDGIIDTMVYPRYLRLCMAMFRIHYVNNECDLTGISDYLESHIMRSDNKSVWMQSSYRKPKDTRLYYEVKNNKVRLITGTESTGYALMLDYYRYPQEINLDTTVPANNVDCELPPQVQEEVVDETIKTYLEKTLNPRYRSFLQEEMIKTPSK